MGTGIGATAYTSATVDRDATIGVQTDDQALIQLTPSGTFSQITQDTTTGTLSINFTSLNANSEFVFGDASAPGTTHAFSITPSEGSDVTLSYVLESGTDPATSNPNVHFSVHTDDGTTVTNEATASEEGSGTFTAAASTDYFVVLTIDTTGVDGSNSAALSGTLTISA